MQWHLVTLAHLLKEFPFKTVARDSAGDKLDYEITQQIFLKQMLQAHNYYRPQHGVPSLTLDNTISRSAPSHAKHLVKIDQMGHSNEIDDLGEKL
ncbi:unnamed protein product [Rotaria magnacalcarata]|uniref:SCP domain-containing protein n=1 Tax=Rotaria magnacalcarata TaxID=392030 RepID=A0A815BCG2_9BILA|nr:unnamed protein product [Rotaria magnacalcarata]CAF2046473.1 unnamed protein product [Rotaria magnacalcarata]CAF2141769.1 unnamed protein product [Rotaria magnacalcarata]CAF4571467.1 unnamed protein product [Rotaria magnacalcarata]